VRSILRKLFGILGIVFGFAVVFVARRRRVADSSPLPPDPPRPPGDDLDPPTDSKSGAVPPGGPRLDSDDAPPSNGTKKEDSGKPPVERGGRPRKKNPNGEVRGNVRVFHEAGRAPMDRSKLL
jgi:hypothetical protein